MPCKAVCRPLTEAVRELSHLGWAPCCVPGRVVPRRCILGVATPGCYHNGSSGNYCTLAHRCIIDVLDSSNYSSNCNTASHKRRHALCQNLPRGTLPEQDGKSSANYKPPSLVMVPELCHITLVPTSCARRRRATRAQHVPSQACQPMQVVARSCSSGMHVWQGHTAFHVPSSS